MSNSSGKSGDIKKKNWLPYLVRGVMGVIIAITLIQQLLGAQASNFWIYLGFYFIANGILSLKQARMAPTKTSGATLSALISIIGGAVMVVTFPFSAYRTTLQATDLGRTMYGVIIGVIGVLEVLGRVSVTKEPVLKQSHLVSGGLEMLLGFVLIISPVSWATLSIALAWIVLVTFYMFLIAYRLRSDSFSKSSSITS